MSAPDLSIAIVSWNTHDLLAACLRSLPDGARARAVEVIVVDNASSDGSADMVRASFPAVRVIESASNLGFAPACNRAWPESRGRYFMLLNPDTEVRAGSLDRLVAFMDAHPRAGLAGARLVNPDGTPQHSAQRAPSVSLTLLEAARLHKLLAPATRARTLLGPYWACDRSIEVGWTWGTALVARRQAVAEAGPLDESFVMYGEDLEWCLRMRARGWQVWHCAEAEVVHHGGASSRQRWDARARTFRVEDAVYRALEQHRGAAYVGCLRAARFAALIAEGAASVLRGRPWRRPLADALEYHWHSAEAHGSDHRHPHP